MMLAQQRRFFIFTCRDVATDFRWPLAEALRERHETWYIWLRRRPRILRPGATMMEDLPLAALLALLRRLTGSGSLNVYLNSTNTSFPLTMLALRLVCGTGLWCLDMHDDLLYDLAGWHRARAALAIKLQTSAADLVIRAAESLVELFPASLPFGNASQIGPIERSIVDYRAVLVLASLDGRFDFAFMAATAAAAPARIFDIYGHVSRSNAKICANMVSLCKAHGNVVYHGAYALADLEPILSRYSVSLAPYRTHHRLTRYLDPLRFYHCLNSGMELITTAIPQAEILQPGLHIVRTAAEVELILMRLETGEAQRNTAGNYRRQTWEARAEDLVHIATEFAIPRRPVKAAAFLKKSGAKNF
jgi:hypothetical protein